MHSHVEQSDAAILFKKDGLFGALIQEADFKTQIVAKEWETCNPDSRP